MRRRKPRRFDEPVIVVRQPFVPNAALIKKSLAKYYGTAEVRDAGCGIEVQPVAMHPQPDHIPASYTLAKRPTRDDREEELPQLRTADGRVLAIVERVDPSSLLN